jgi:hypothetical protein
MVRVYEKGELGAGYGLEVSLRFPPGQLQIWSREVRARVRRGVRVERT